MTDTHPDRKRLYIDSIRVLISDSAPSQRRGERNYTLAFSYSHEKEEAPNDDLSWVAEYSFGQFISFRKLIKEYQRLAAASSDGRYHYHIASCEFPRTSYKKKLGMRLSAKDIEQRCHMLNAWLREVLANYPFLCHPAKLCVIEFLDLPQRLSAHFRLCVMEDPCQEQSHNVGAGHAATYEHPTRVNIRTTTSSPNAAALACQSVCYPDSVNHSNEAMLNETKEETSSGGIADAVLNCFLALCERVASAMVSTRGSCSWSCTCISRSGAVCYHEQSTLLRYSGGVEAVEVVVLLFVLALLVRVCIADELHSFADCLALWYHRLLFSRDLNGGLVVDSFINQRLDAWDLSDYAQMVLVGSLMTFIQLQHQKQRRLQTQLSQYRDTVAAWYSQPNATSPASSATSNSTSPTADANAADYSGLGDGPHQPVPLSFSPSFTLRGGEEEDAASTYSTDLDLEPGAEGYFSLEQAPVSALDDGADSKIDVGKSSYVPQVTDELRRCREAFDSFEFHEIAAGAQDSLTPQSPFLLPGSKSMFRDLRHDHRFKVRGKSYIEDGGKKIHPGSALCKLFLFEIYEVDTAGPGKTPLPLRHDHVASMGLARRRREQIAQGAGDPFQIIINYQIPGDPPISMVSFFAVPPDAPELLDPFFAPLFERFIDAPRTEKERRAAWGELSTDTAYPDTQPDPAQDDPDTPQNIKKQGWLTDILWPDDGSDPGTLPQSDIRNQRFKLVPGIAEGPWVLRAAVRPKPALLGRKVVQRYFRGDNYLEIDVHVGSSRIAANIVSVCRTYMHIAAAEVGIVIQGEDSGELPEKMLACSCLAHIDISLRRKLL